MSPELPGSFVDLMTAAANTPTDSSQYAEIAGSIALFLSSIACQQNVELFQELMREVGLSVPTDAAKKIFKTVQQWLDIEEKAWLQTQIEAILSGNTEV